MLPLVNIFLGGTSGPQRFITYIYSEAIMRGSTTALFTLMIPMVGCHVATGDGYFGGFTVKTGLFMEYATSTNLNGSGSFLFSDGEVTCDDLETGLESGSMWRETENQNGVYGTLTYQLTEDPDQDPWIGAYGSGYVPLPHNLHPRAA